MSLDRYYADVDQHNRFRPELIDDIVDDDLPEMLREWAESHAPDHVADTLDLAAGKLEAGETDETLAVTLLICARTRKDRGGRKLIMRAAHALAAE